MKLTFGFISNSSATSFVVSLSVFSPNDQEKIRHLTDWSDDFSRRTGRISDIDGYLKMYAEDEWIGPHYREDVIRCLMEKYSDLVILRESDEQAGGEFSDVGLSYDVIAEKALIDFEQH